MSTLDEFKQCMRVEASLDLEAIDVAFVQPLKDLQAWWERQSEVTKSLFGKITAGVGAAALSAFIAKVVGATVGELTAAFSEALGAIIVGIGLGLFFAALARCKLREVETLMV